MKKHIHTCPTFLGVRNCALLPGINTPCTHKKDQARKSRFQGTNFHQWISNIWIDSARLASFAKAEIGIQWYSEWPSQVPRFISLELLYLRKSIPTIQIVKLWRSQELHMVFWNMEALLSKRILLHIFATNRPLDERDTFKHWVNLSSYRLVQFYSSCYFNFISKKILVLCKKKWHFFTTYLTFWSYFSAASVFFECPDKSWHTLPINTSGLQLSQHTMDKTPMNRFNTVKHNNQWNIRFINRYQMFSHQL